MIAGPRRSSVPTIRVFLIFLIGFALPVPVACASSRSAPPSGAFQPPKLLFVAPTGSDSGQCTSTSPCVTLDRAYRVAQPGQTVQIADGTYGAQRIAADPSKVGPRRVIFRPETGAHPSFDDLDVFASHLEFQSLITSVWHTEPGAADVVFRNLTTRLFFITSSRDISVIGGSVGPSVNQASEIRNCTNCTTISSGIRIDGVFFHDYVRTDPNVHMECLHAYPVQNMQVVNSRFSNCAIMDLFLANYGNAGDLSNIVVENNYFDSPGSRDGQLSAGYYAVMFEYGAASLSNVHLAYNSMLAPPIIDGTSGKVSNVAFIANVGAFSPWLCLKGVTYARNVWTQASCSPTDTRAPSDFVQAGTLDLRLQPHAAAIGHGDPSDFPRTDIFRNLRSPQAPDAGASQAEPAAIVPGESIGGARLGMKRKDIEALYGRPTGQHTEKGHAGHQTVYAYRRGSGGISVVYDAGGQVVGVWTSSRYYLTANGLATGTQLAKAKALLPGLRKLKLCYVQRRSLNGVSLELGMRGGVIAQIAILRPSVTHSC
jgi:hypothetical protein